MTIFQNILSDEQVETLLLDQDFVLGAKPFHPTLGQAKLTYTPTQFDSIELKVELDNSSEIQAVQALIEKCGYTTEEIKARVFTRLPVVLTWKAKKEVLEKYQNQLIPYARESQLWTIKDEDRKAVFLDLDTAYHFESLEV